MRWVLALAILCRLSPGRGLPTQPYDGTYHFVSSAFPEMDSRGFYEHLFDDIGDYYPSWRRISFKEYPEMSNLDLDELPPQISMVRAKRDLAISLDRNLKAVANASSPKEGAKQRQANHLIGKRSPSRHARGMEMGSSGFHEDTFNSAFGDFVTMRRRRIARTAMEKERMDHLLDKLTSDRGENVKMSQQILNGLRHPETLNHKHDTTDRLPDLLLGLNALLRQGPRTDLRQNKRRPEMDSAGFHGDTFGGSFGDFDTMKKKAKSGNKEYNMYAEPYTSNWLFKRRPEMDSSGFHGDVFGGSFGEFDTMKKRRPEMDSSGFHGDTFGGSFGEFDTMKKRRPEMDSSGFHGDVFGGSFGEFDTMKKRRPEMDSSGFHGDTFGGSFGEFDTMKKRRPEMDSSGFHGDTFGGSFGEFDTMKKRRPEMDSSGFHGDTFGGSFGEFDTMRKRMIAVPSNFHSEVTKRSTNVPDSPSDRCGCGAGKAINKDDKQKQRFSPECLKLCPTKI